MITYTALLDRFEKITGDDSTDNTTFGGLLINETQKLIAGSQDWPWTEATLDRTSTASQQTIKLPADYRTLITYYVTSGGTRYTPEEMADPVGFDRIDYLTTPSTSDFPQIYHIRSGAIINWPAISSAGNTIHLIYHKLPRDMVADYTTGTITAVTNGDETVEATGSTWTAAAVTSMSNPHIKLPDGKWYKVSSFTDADTLELDIPYEGTTGAALTATYTLTDAPLVPEEYHDLLWLRPVSMYYQMKGDENRAQFYQAEYDTLLTSMKRKYASKTAYNVVKRNRPMINPNYNPRSVTIT